jgi:hypothetical protein
MCNEDVLKIFNCTAKNKAALLGVPLCCFFEDTRVVFNQ